MAGVEADEEINPVAMEVGKVEEDMDEELDTDMVVFRVGELGEQCGNWSDDVGSCNYNDAMMEDRNISDHLMGL